ncbi:hypothetical protein GIB67_030981 [Kingdonia uniflora]|uniref:Aminotransferase-like plant mobile domain-containing protein n=1 Tax=Kingdonia uniflora TaxID=39325 RepID=A0A7J7L3Q4_9MAGN|nr:hypothetical protein GIB67_030981 [Kingdonia uniflora]
MVMDLFSLCLVLLLLILLHLILLRLLPLLINKKRGDTKSRFPPSPPKLPIIGNLHQISKMPHPSLLRLSQKHGPVMLLQVGPVPTVIISSAEMAREVLKTHDHVLCSKPLLDGFRQHSYNFKEVAFSPYGKYWREMRKICVHEIFSIKRVQSFQYVRDEEVEYIVNSISASSPCVLNLHEKVTYLMDHILQRIAFGRSYKGKKGDACKISELVHGGMDMMAYSSTPFFFPYAGSIIDHLTGSRSRLEKNFQALDSLLQQVVDEHAANPIRERPENEDIIDVLLRLESDHLGEVRLTKDHIKAVLMDIFVAGIDTTTITLVWAMAELVKNPRVMKKVQDEVRGHVGKKGKVEESDLDQLVYLKMVLKETLRLHPPSSILIPRESMDYCSINGYDIHPKTIVIVNIWAIGRNPDSWKNPEDFFPERFMDSSIDYKGQDFEFLPFGAGRRGCPGMSLSVVTMEIALANLLYSFNWELPTGMKIEDLDMEEDGTFIIQKKSGLLLRPIKYNWEHFIWYQSDLVESDPVAMAEGPNATDPAQVLAPHVEGPSANPRPLNTRTRLDQLEEKMQALSGIIDQVTTLEERLDSFSDDQAHVGERLVTLEGVVEGNMATLLDQVAELSSKGQKWGYKARGGIDQGHGQNRSGGASTGGASSSNSGREYHRPRNNGGASSSSRFRGRPGNLKYFLCGGNHKAYQCPQKTALNALMASHGDQADDTTQGNDSGIKLGISNLIPQVSQRNPFPLLITLKMSGESSSRPKKNASKTTRNSNAEVKRRGNADIINVWLDQLTDYIDPTPSYDELNRVDIPPDGWVHISIGSEKIPNRDELQCKGLLDKVLKWYRWIAVYLTLKKLVDDMGFVKFCSINAGNSDNRLIHALVERWWPSTHTFYFPCGELGLTPLDFVMLMGISFGRGRELSYDERSRQLTRSEVRVASALSTQRVPLASVSYGHGTSSQVKDYGVHATGDPRDLGWFMDVAGLNDQRKRIPILVMQERMAYDTFFQLQRKPFALGEAYKVLETCPKWSQIHHIGHPGRNVARKSNFKDSPGMYDRTAKKKYKEKEMAKSSIGFLGKRMLETTPNMIKSWNQRDEQKKERKEGKARAREELKLAREAKIQRRREAELTRIKAFDDVHMFKVMTTDPSNLQPTQRRWMKKQIKEYSNKLKE